MPELFQYAEPIIMTTTLLILPFAYWLIKLHTRVLILETKNKLNKEFISLLFKKSDDHKKKLHKVEIKTTRIIAILSKKQKLS